MKGENIGQRKLLSMETLTGAPRLPSSVWKGCTSLAFGFDDFLQVIQHSMGIVALEVKTSSLAYHSQLA